MHLVNKTTVTVRCEPDDCQLLAPGPKGEMISIIEKATEDTVALMILFPKSARWLANKTLNKAQKIQAGPIQTRQNAVMELAAGAAKLGARVFVNLPRVVVYDVTAARAA